MVSAEVARTRLSPAFSPLFGPQVRRLAQIRTRLGSGSVCGETWRAYAGLARTGLYQVEVKPVGPNAGLDSGLPFAGCPDRQITHLHAQIRAVRAVSRSGAAPDTQPLTG